MPFHAVQSLTKSSRRFPRYFFAVHFATAAQPIRLRPEEPLSETENLQQIPFEEASQEQQVDILTCGKLFSKWRQERAYWTVPKGDVSFRVRYIDTGRLLTNPNKSPSVLALHGSPGSYRDFEHISTRLHERGIRVISPLFPDVNTVKLGKFRHTPEEKSEYVKDFLQAIDLPRVDLLLCHSSALFPGLLLCLEEQRLRVNSACFLNPTAFDHPRVMKPFWMTHLLTRMFEFPVGYHVTDVVGKILLKFKSQLKGGNHSDHFLSAFTMVHSHIPKRTIHFEQLLRSNFPMLLAFSENDKLIERKSLLKMARMLADDADFQRYDAKGKLDRAGGANPFHKVLVFENGTHFLYKKYPDVISEAISLFLFQHFDRERL